MSRDNNNKRNGTKKKQVDRKGFSVRTGPDLLKDDDFGDILEDILQQKPVYPQNAPNATVDRTVHLTVVPETRESAASLDSAATVTKETLEAKLNDDEFIKELIDSERQIINYKLSLYARDYKQVKQEIEEDSKRIHELESDPNWDLNVDTDLKHDIESVVSRQKSLYNIIQLLRTLMKREKEAEDAEDDPRKMQKLIEQKRNAMNSALRDIDTIKGDAREPIRQFLYTRIVTFALSPGMFRQSFQNNIILMGGAGTGKSKVAEVFAKVFVKLGILAYTRINHRKVSDLLGQYLGETAPKTRGVLFDSLERVLFIDEAYALTACPPDYKDGQELDQQGNQYGVEAVNQIVDFLSEHAGLLVVILAGYQGVMEKCFLKQNEGLARRFGSKYVLSNYSSSDLYSILFDQIFRKMEHDIFAEVPSIWSTIRSYIEDLNANQDYPVFQYQAGDMQNLADAIIEELALAPSMQQVSVHRAFNNFLRQKHLRISSGDSSALVDTTSVNAPSQLSQLASTQRKRTRSRSRSTNRAYVRSKHASSRSRSRSRSNRRRRRTSKSRRKRRTRRRSRSRSRSYSRRRRKSRSRSRAKRKSQRRRRASRSRSRRKRQHQCSRCSRRRRAFR